MISAEPNIERDLDNRTFRNLVRVVPTWHETPDNFTHFKDEINFIKMDLNCFVTNCEKDVDDAKIYKTNLAGFLVWHNKIVFLNLLLNKDPSLMWQRTYGYEVLMTPLDIAVHCGNSILVSTILSHTVLTKYAQQYPEHYRPIVANSLRLARNEFSEPRSFNEVTIVSRLQKEIEPYII